jgi:hypothetical protein
MTWLQIIGGGLLIATIAFLILAAVNDDDEVENGNGSES